MADKPVPEFMKLYMERCGHDSWLDYTRLSREYHATRQVYHEKKFPNYIPNTPYSRHVPVDIEADMRRIDAGFKEKALQLGYKHGYEDPGRQDYDSYLSGQQESGAYRDMIEKDDFGLLPEDVRAKQAHAAFDKKFPEKEQEREINRESIENFFGNPSTLSYKGKEAPEKEAKPDKEGKQPLSREELFSSYVASGKDITDPPKRFTMSHRFSMPLHTEPKAPESPTDPGLSHEDGEIDIDKDL